MANPVIDGLNINGIDCDLSDTAARHRVENLDAVDIAFNEDSQLGTVAGGLNRRVKIADYYIDIRLLLDNIKNTRQVVVKTNGKVTGVNHIDGNNHTVRSDTFAVDSDPMVETRTLDTGERLTISTDLTTLTSTITYTPASA